MELSAGAAIVLLIVVGVVYALGSLVFWYQFRAHWYPLQYLYFLRFPIALGSLLALSFLGAVKLQAAWPPISRDPGPFLNLFLLDDLGLFLTSFLAVMTAWTIVHSARWIYANAPQRLALPLRGSVKLPDGTTRSLPNVVRPDGLGGRMHLVYALLGLPLVVCSVAVSPGPLWRRSLMAGAGLGLAYLLRLAVVGAGAGGRRRLPPPVARLASVVFALGARLSELGGGVARIAGWIGDLVRRGARWLARPIWSRLDERVPEDTPESHVPREDPTSWDAESIRITGANLRRFLSITLLVYLLGAVLLYPGWSSRWPDVIPPVAYLLVLVMLLAWVLAWLALLLDKFRIPAELALLGIWALLYTAFGTDHSYRIVAEACGDGSQQAQAVAVSPGDYLRAWQDVRDATAPRTPTEQGCHDLMIVVAASGGGRTAAFWTATVLTRLQQLHPECFAQRIALVSTTSGGGVGAMYYVEGFARGSRGGVTPPAQLAGVLEAAGHRSLSALGWGLVYPELARLFVPPLVERMDRGWALEERWQQQFSRAGSTRRPLLSEWAAEERAGWRPAMIFNAVLAESGQRFLITPLAVHGPGVVDPLEGAWRARSFRRLYPGADLSVATAARLSATFPYVTPLARPELPASCDWKAYHVADGGYYDNFGVMSAVEFLRAVVPQFHGSRVLLVEIRAGDSSKERPPRLDNGWRNELIGPIDTLLAVRTSSQIARNNLEVELLGQELQEEGRALHRAVFELRMPTPTSWNLSQGEQRCIQRYWDTSPDVARRLGELDEVLGPGLAADASPPASGDDLVCPGLVVGKPAAPGAERPGGDG